MIIGSAGDNSCVSKAVLINSVFVSTKGDNWSGLAANGPTMIINIKLLILIIATTDISRLQ